MHAELWNITERCRQNISYVHYEIAHDLVEVAALYHETHRGENICDTLYGEERGDLSTFSTGRHARSDE